MIAPLRLLRRVQSLFRRRRLEADLDEEVRAHLDLEAARLEAQGIPPVEARRRARAAFGGLERVKEESREARGTGVLEDLLQDLRYGLRSLRHTPGFTVAALLTLALGVGGPAAIFGAMRGMLLKPLPYAEADRLLFLWQHDRNQGNDRIEPAPANFLDWRERNRSFQILAALEPYGLDWQSEQGPVYIPTWLVSESFFDMMGVQPLHGRVFLPEEHEVGRGDDRGSGDAVILGYGLWQQRFGADPAVVGKTLQLDGRAVLVAGVMPESFAIPTNEAAWAPKAWQGWEAQSRSSTFYTVIGRLRDGVTPGQAQAEMDGIASQLASEYPATNSGSGIVLVPLPEQLLGRLRDLLLVLLGAVVVVFLIAGANLGNLQLARATNRAQEFAVRGALGAGRGRVTRQLVTESVLLAGLGCVLGFVLAGQTLAVLRALAPTSLPRLPELRADGWVLGFSVVAAVGVALLTGVLPVGLAGRANLRAGLGGRGLTAGRGTRRVRGGLVVAQIALSLVLLIGAGLLLRSFVTLLNEHRGFRTERLGVMTVQSWSYISAAERPVFVREATARMAQLPGVRGAAVANGIPLAEGIGAEWATYTIPGQPVPEGAEPNVLYNTVTDDYFRTLGIALRGGRLFDGTEGPGTAPVALITEALARRHWPDQNPIGHRIAVRFGGRSTEREIVGVVGDIRRLALSEAPHPTVYVPFAQSATGANAFFVWTDGDPAALRPRLKQVVWEFNPNMPVYSETTMEEVVGESVRERRFLLTLLGLFAGLAFLLAAVGIFGVMSYATAERTREIGVRMAFGARRRDVIRMVMGNGGALALAGIALGLLVAAFVTRLLRGMLYAVAPLDPLTFLAGALVLLAAALLACWAPAARAARLDPVGALRSE